MNHYCVPVMLLMATQASYIKGTADSGSVPCRNQSEDCGHCSELQQPKKMMPHVYGAVSDTISSSVLVGERGGHTQSHW